jgi:hypothetical protein
MTLVLKYLNLSQDNDELIGFSCNKINNYNNLFKLEQKEIEDILIDKIKNYIINKFEKLSNNNCDVNYYINNINLISIIKFKEIIKEIEIDYMIIDYNNKNNKNNKNYKYYQNKYYTYFYETINKLEFNIQNKKYMLYEIFNKLWNNIKFKNIIEFSNLLNKFNYFGKDISNLKNLIIEKFDDEENIIKLINYIVDNFILDEENLNNEHNFSNEDIKFNFRFIIDNLKSNGYMLFEKYNILLKKRYIDKINIEDIKKDLKIVKYFIYIVRNKESNSVNKFVNDILIKMRDYLIDINDSYLNNNSFKLIEEKNSILNNNRDVDLKKLKNNMYQFKILKYNNVEDELIEDYKLSTDLEPYFNIYSSYYNIKYEDREIDYDIINTTLIVQIKFSKTYQIHMALIQYLVLDILYKKNNNISLIDISKEINIPLSNKKLEDTLNSLLKLKLIKKLSNNEEIILSINNEFNMDDTKISISSLIKNKSVNNNTKEFLHDRQTIIYCNIIDFIKKNTILYEDTVINIIQYKIPFKITPDMIKIALNEAISNKYISQVEIENNTNKGSQFIYKYIE